MKSSSFLYIALSFLCMISTLPAFFAGFDLAVALEPFMSNSIVTMPLPMLVCVILAVYFQHRAENN
jgi:hypothetical protein